MDEHVQIKNHLNLRFFYTIRSYDVLEDKFTRLTLADN